jgi:hypothetical protein
VTLVLQNLRSEVLRCTTKCKSSVINDLCKPKICEFEISIRANQNIFRFEVSIDNVLAVKILDDEDNLCCIESALRKSYAALCG